MSGGRGVYLPPLSTTAKRLSQPTFKPYDFLLMPTNDHLVNQGPPRLNLHMTGLRVAINRGMPKSFSTLEIWAKLADIGLVGYSRGAWGSWCA